MKNLILCLLFIILSSHLSGGAGENPYVSGWVLDEDGGPLEGVLLKKEGAPAAVTVKDGSYIFSGFPGQGEIYPTALNYRFEPSSAAAVPDQVFIGFVNRYSVTVRVSDDSGLPVENATVTLTGDDKTLSALTSEEGYSVFEDVKGDGDYGIRVSARHYTFNSPETAVRRLSGNITREFSGVRDSFEISGRVEDVRGMPVSGARVTLSGRPSISAVTGRDGRYRFGGLAPESSFTVSVSKDHYAFSPERRRIPALRKSAADIDFTGTRHMYFIKGYVRDRSGRGIGGVAVRMSGDTRREALTSIDGFYEFNDLAEKGRYVLSPVKKGYRFAPGRRTVPRLEGYITDLDFTGRKALRTYILRGAVLCVDGDPVEDVKLVVLSDMLPSFTRLSDENGFAIPIYEGGYYKIEPVSDKYVFEPAVLSITGVDSSITDFKFTAIPLREPSVLGQQENTIRVVGSASGRGAGLASDGVKVYFRGNAPGRFSLKVFTMDGRLVWNHSMDSGSSGHFKWHARGVSSGTYIAYVRGPGIEKTAKFVILK